MMQQKQLALVRLQARTTESREEVQWRPDQGYQQQYSGGFNHVASASDGWYGSGFDGPSSLDGNQECWDADFGQENVPTEVVGEWRSVERDQLPRAASAGKSRHPPLKLLPICRPHPSIGRFSRARRPHQLHRVLLINHTRLQSY